MARPRTVDPLFVASRVHATAVAAGSPCAIRYRRMTPRIAPVCAPRMAPTHLSLLGEERQFSALNADSSSLPSALADALAGTLDDDAWVIRHAPARRWRNVAAAASASTLSMVVLGTSPAAGCGALDPLRQCDPSRSWTRLLVDCMLTNRSIAPIVHYKNAVDMGYFALCASSYLPPHANSAANLVIVLEATNLWDVGSAHVALSALRRAAPHAVIVVGAYACPLLALATATADPLLPCPHALPKTSGLASPQGAERCTAQRDRLHQRCAPASSTGRRR
jgi:hypothetical protein